MNLLTNRNSKIKHTSKINNSRIYLFDLPAYKNKKGKLICPFSKDCVKYCYAQNGFFTFKSVKNKYEENYKLTGQDNFPDLIKKELDKKKVTHLRIHSSGDFYSKKYLNTWVNLAIKNPKIVFYGYSKSVKMIKEVKKPNNFKFVFSYGGKQDHLIDPKKDFHSKIFKDKKDLLNFGYIDASKNDLIAINKTNNKIGLIYH